MRSKKWWLIVSSVTVLSLLLASCAPAAAPAPKTEPKAAPQVETPAAKTAAAPAAPSPSAKPAADQPRNGGILKTATPYELRDYDFHQAVSVGVQGPLAPLYNGLLQFDPLGDPNNIVGDLAEKWEVSPDGKVHTFYLRKGVQWHDGKPFTSQDVKFSIDRMANPPKGTLSPRKAWFAGLDKIETPDDYTVKVSLQYPRSAFVPYVASAWFKVLAKHIVERLGDAKATEAQVGTGPFMFKEYNSRVVFSTVKNPNYFVKGRPYLDGLTRYYIVDDATRFAAFRSHRIDKAETITMGFSPIQAEIVEKELAGRATVTRFPGMILMIIGMNVQAAPFNDARVRKAAALSMDRTKAKGVVIDEFRVGGFLPPGGKWALPEEELLKMPGYRQPKDADRAEARKLLAEAGYPDGLKVTLIDRARGLAGELRCQWTQDQLKTVGIQAELGPMEEARYYAALNEHRFTMASISVSQDIDDPDAGFISAFHSTGTLNYGQINDKELDDLLDKQSRAMDEKERKDLVLKAQRRIMDLALAFETYWNWGLTGHWNEVRNWKPGTGIRERTMFQDVWLAQ